MGIPACLWRRTGEIYKGNREFAELVGVSEYMLRDVRQKNSSIYSGIDLHHKGRLCIYEIMAEESAVNFWEVCFIQFAVFLSPTYTGTSIRNTDKLHLIRRRKLSSLHVC